MISTFSFTFETPKWRIVQFQVDTNKSKFCRQQRCCRLNNKFDTTFYSSFCQIVGRIRNMHYEIIQKSYTTPTLNVQNLFIILPMNSFGELSPLLLSLATLQLVLEDNQDRFRNEQNEIIHKTSTAHVVNVRKLLRIVQTSHHHTAKILYV